MSLRSQDSPWFPLIAAKSEIRLLRLEPATGFAADLKGSFEIRSLNHHPRYDAISHAWGRPGTSEIIRVGKSAMLIPLSLAHCLRQLRRTDEPRFLWVDAIWYIPISSQLSLVLICAVSPSMTSLSARNKVQLMQQIFSYAVCVRAWLGHGLIECSEGFRALETCLTSQQSAQSKVLSSEQCKAISALVRTDWWDRLWV